MSKVIWMTGLSGSGKTTISKNMCVIDNRLIHLDGDEIRSSLSSDLGFSQRDRSIHNERVAKLAKLLSDKGFNVVVSLISPLKLQRYRAKKIIGKNFFEVFVDCPLEICKERDPKGLYRKQIENFTGIDSEYESPTNPDLHIDTFTFSIRECVIKTMELLWFTA